MVSVQQWTGLEARALRRSLRLSIRGFAEALGVAVNTVSKWESLLAETRPNSQNQAILDTALVQADAAVHTRFETFLSETGWLPSEPQSNDVTVPLDRSTESTDPQVVASQQQWRLLRARLNSQRASLTEAAARLYPVDVQVQDTGLIADPNWLMKNPVDLVGLRIHLDPNIHPVAVTGSEREAHTCLPLQSAEHRYHRYSTAIRDLAAPRLLDNRLSYRLLDVDWAHPERQMRFGFTTYFELIDTIELAAHEIAQSHLREDDDRIARPSWRDLPWRQALGDPFDLSRRTLLPSINTLTIRHDPNGSPSMILHRRDAANVAVAGSMLHVMPAGVFQPSSLIPAAIENDFDLWRNVMREFSEEFLGNPEHDGGGAPIDYAVTAPFAELEAARQTGKLRIWCFGIALDALTLAGEILTVCVIDADVYDAIFADLVDVNAEGHVSATRVPFEEHTINHLTTGPRRLAPAAAGCIKLAWQHRHEILPR